MNRTENRPRPLFVVGAGRSGTTLLQQMLDHHPSFAFAWESHFIPHFYRRVQKFGDLDVLENRIELIRAIEKFLKVVWRGRVDPAWIPDFEAAIPEMARQATPNYAGIVDAVLGYFAQQRGRPRWGDKTPGYVNSLPLLFELFPDAQFIHLIRDGRDVACSIMPLSFGPNTVYTAARKWKHSVQHALKFADEHPQSILTLRYEDLIDDPEKHLREICDFLGEQFFPDMLTFHQDGLNRVPGSGIHDRIGRPVDKQRTQRWKRELSPEQIRVFEAVAGPLLSQLDYEISNPQARLKPLDRSIGKAADKLLRLRPFTKPDGLLERAFARCELARLTWHSQ